MIKPLDLYNQAVDSGDQMRTLLVMRDIFRPVLAGEQTDLSAVRQKAVEVFECQLEPDSVSAEFGRIMPTFGLMIDIKLAKGMKAGESKPRQILCPAELV